MIAQLTLTEYSNIDLENKVVIDNNKVFKESYHWDKEVDVFDEDLQKNIQVRIADISLYKHLLFINGNKHKILHMFSK